MKSLQTYLKELEACKVLSPYEQTQLAIRAKGGCKISQDLLVKSNLRFVLSIAKQYQGQGVPFEDIVAEGNIGILKAIAKFDETKNTRFITYAGWWIRQSILAMLHDYKRHVRLPANRIHILGKLRKNERNLQQKLQRDPTLQELLDSADYDLSDVVDQSSFSYHDKVHDSDDLEVLDSIENSDVASPDEAMIVEGVQREIRNVVNKLEDRERIIIKMYFGIEHERPYTLEEIGDALDLTRERIRQIKTKALKELRRFNRRGKFEPIKD